MLAQRTDGSDTYSLHEHSRIGHLACDYPAVLYHYVMRLAPLFTPHHSVPEMQGVQKCHIRHTPLHDWRLARRRQLEGVNP